MAQKKRKTIRIFTDDEGNQTTPDKGTTMEEHEYDEKGNLIAIRLYRRSE